MVTPGMIYAIGILDNIHMLLCAFTGISLIALIISICAMESVTSIYTKIFAPIFICCTIATALLPSTKLAAAMFVVPAIANNEDVRAIGGNSLEALRKLTEQWLLELHGNGHARPAEKKQL